MRTHWDHEPGGANGPLTPTLSPSEGAREMRRERASRFGVLTRRQFVWPADLETCAGGLTPRRT
ncbi:hypothetical protein SBV1_60017 [Verrucomicrobia bacterium]|nr:hypothetical protein SBV1_60017 [Verrucomicrobiota bacterium]